MAHILVIDDEPDIRLLIRGLLEKAGHRIDEASNGEEGLIRASENDYAVVVCDLIMPDKEGIETIMELRRRHPDARVVAVSGGGIRRQMNILHMAQKLGADRILPKPFDPEEFVEAIKDLLRPAA